MCNCMKEPVEVFFARENETVIIPSKNEEDAGFDIYANFQEKYFVIHPHETKMIPTNLRSAIPKTHYFQLFERGSTGTKGMGQRCGVVDSGYRNTWFVPVTNHNNDKSIVITKEKDESALDVLKQDYIVYPYSKAICQAVLIEIPSTKVTEITTEKLLKIDSVRGLGQLGSSNK